MTVDAIVENSKSIGLALQEVMRQYYEGNIEKALDNLAMVKNRVDTLQYHLFQSMHRSGERG